jgi:hypothetical protein
MGGKHRACNQTPKVFALIQQRLKPIEIGADFIDGTGFERELKKRRSVTLCDTGNKRGRVSHGHSFPELPSKRCALF